MIEQYCQYNHHKPPSRVVEVVEQPLTTSRVEPTFRIPHIALPQLHSPASRPRANDPESTDGMGHTVSTVPSAQVTTTLEKAVDNVRLGGPWNRDLEVVEVGERSGVD
ncbi:hypothetical protein LXL04_025094 [Taraxacum kok-saghyz]